MTLGFTQTINNNASYFVEKITKSIPGITPKAVDLAIKAGYEFNNLVYLKVAPKIHTAREDKKGLWYPGMKINAVINNRTNRRCQFVPDMPCIHTQTMVINWGYDPKTAQFDLPMVLIDGKEIKGKVLDQLAVNDGFENRAEFFQYFNQNWSGKLIHWTNFKY